jgi:putative ABC transport system permease protein
MLKKLDKNISIPHQNNKFFYGFECFGLSIGIAGLIFATLYWNDERYDKWNLKG